jgi:flagellar FliJ protein
MAEYKSIELAIELATRQRDELARAHGQAQRNLSFARDQLAHLAGYAGETDARWVGATRMSISPEILHHHYQFMARLQQAIAMQDGVIANLDIQLVAAHQALLQAEFRLSGLSQVLKKRLDEAQLRRKRSEQRHTDEFAALRHLHNKAALMHGEHDDYRN